MRYLCTVGAFGLLALGCGLLMRFELLGAEGVLGADTYTRAFTLHGVTAIFGVMTPVLWFALSRLVLPAKLGISDVAFPRLDRACFWVWLASVTLLLGVTALGDAAGMTPSPWMAAALGCVTGVSLVAAANLAVTIVRARDGGRSLFARAILWVCVFQVPALAIAIGTWIRDETGGAMDEGFVWAVASRMHSTAANGLVLGLGIGVVSDTLAPREEPMPGRRLLDVAVVWAVLHPIVSVVPGAALLDVLLTTTVLIVWRRAARQQRGRSATTSIWIFAFGSAFFVAQILGAFLWSLSVDVHLHDTYFVVGRFHYMASCGLLALAVGLFASWRELTGRDPAPRLGVWGAALTFVGLHVTFFFELVLGQQGMPRRYYEYLPTFEMPFRVSGAGAVLLCVGLVLSVVALAANGPRRPPGRGS
jgi:cytochrome c oxidase subunit 1